MDKLAEGGQITIYTLKKKLSPKRQDFEIRGLKCQKMQKNAKNISKSLLVGGKLMTDSFSRQQI